MSNVEDDLKIISRDIQNAFEELIRLLLRKTLKPVLNQISPRTKKIKNNFLDRYERGYLGSCSEDKIGNYCYILTHDCLGWVDDNINNFKIVPKFIKNTQTQSYGKNNNRLNLKSRISAGDKTCRLRTDYQNLIELINTRNVQNLIASGKNALSYHCGISYKDCFKNLQSIGYDIINQTDPSIPPQTSMKLSTSMLRSKLYRLDQNLAKLEKAGSVYDDFVKMILTINSVPKGKIIWIINLLSVLSFQKWGVVKLETQQTYYKTLGEDVIEKILQNNLIQHLIKMDKCELILKCAYLYSLLKMLFVVFGFGKITPIVLLDTVDSYPENINERRKSMLRRGQDNKIKGQMIEFCEKIYPADYDFINLFDQIYPNILCIMGGSKKFPPENLKIYSEDVPRQYNDLDKIPQYLWRYHDYSYCQYLKSLHLSTVDQLQKKIEKKSKSLKLL